MTAFLQSPSEGACDSPGALFNVQCSFNVPEDILIVLMSRFLELCNLSIKQFLFDFIRMSLIELRGEIRQSQEPSSLQAGRNETQM